MDEYAERQKKIRTRPHRDDAYHRKVRAALRAAIAHNDWILAENSTVGVDTVGFWDIA